MVTVLMAGSCLPLDSNIQRVEKTPDHGWSDEEFLLSPSVILSSSPGRALHQHYRVRGEIPLELSLLLHSVLCACGIVKRTDEMCSKRIQRLLMELVTG